MRSQRPPGADGWQDLYPYYTQFNPKRRAEDDQTFWFCNSQHWPTPFRPFDVIMVDFATKSLGQYNTRHLLVPPENGVDYRILNGYVYFSPVGVNPQDIEACVPQFMERAGHYFANWGDLYANWKTKVMAQINALESLDFTTLPEVEPLDVVTSGAGAGQHQPAVRPIRPRD